MDPGIMATATDLITRTHDRDLGLARRIWPIKDQVADKRYLNKDQLLPSSGSRCTIQCDQSIAIARSESSLSLAPHLPGRTASWGQSQPVQTT